MDEKYSCIISLGMRCFTEIFLKNMSFKQFSMPFDGMFSVKISDIIDIMKNGINYNDLIYTEILNDPLIIELNKKHGYRTINKKINYNSNDIIESYHNAFLPHHNLNNIDVKNHFDKCFKRLKKIKNDKIKTLFCLFIFPNYSIDKDIILEDIYELSNFLSNNYNCTLLVCCFKKINNYYKIKKIIDDKNIIYFHINNNSHNFYDNKNELEIIFSEFKIDKNNLMNYNSIN